MKRSEAVKAATNGVSRAWHHSERNSYPGTSPLLTSVINELRKGVRHATLRASVSAYRVVLFLTGSIRSYPPYKVGILRWTHEREHQKPTSSRAWIRRCAPALSCSPQDKHLEAFAFPLRAGCRLRAISGLQPLSGCAYQRARVHQHRAQPLALWLWTGPPTRQWKEAYLEKACLWHPVDNSSSSSSNYFALDESLIVFWPIFLAMEIFLYLSIELIAWDLDGISFSSFPDFLFFFARCNLEHLSVRSTLRSLIVNRRDFFQIQRMERMRNLFLLVSIEVLDEEIP